MNDGLISCIIPVFNGERYLAEAVERILKQIYRPMEISVVDDRPTDGTVAIVYRYKEKVRYLKQKNLGPASRTEFLRIVKSVIDRRRQEGT